ncbi:hypothetical protein WDU94_007084 [Cyamophila willieti]
MIQDRIETSRLKWYGHVRRMNEERLPNKYLEMKMEGRRKQGRPRLRWKDIINRDIVKRNQNPSLIERNQTFRDRMWWRGTYQLKPPCCMTLLGIGNTPPGPREYCIEEEKEEEEEEEEEKKKKKKKRKRKKKRKEKEERKKEKKKKKRRKEEEEKEKEKEKERRRR